MIITESGKFRKGHHASGHLQLTESARLVSVADLRDRSLRGPASPAQYGVAGKITTLRYSLATAPWTYSLGCALSTISKKSRPVLAGQALGSLVTSSDTRTTRLDRLMEILLGVFT
jgi:hypothetical protein